MTPGCGGHTPLGLSGWLLFLNAALGNDLYPDAESANLFPGGPHPRKKKTRGKPPGTILSTVHAINPDSPHCSGNRDRLGARANSSHT